MYRTIDLGVYHPWPSVIRLGCAEVVGGRLQESAIDKSDNGYEPFRSSAPVDFYSTWSTSSRSWETLRVKIKFTWTNRIFRNWYAAAAECYPLEYICRKLRSQVYRILCLWVAASRSACGMGKCVDILFSQLLSDILVHRDTVQLLTGRDKTGERK
jgi:hypothetical protein